MVPVVNFLIGITHFDFFLFLFYSWSDQIHIYELRWVGCWVPDLYIVYYSALHVQETSYPVSDKIESLFPTVIFPRVGGAILANQSAIGFLLLQTISILLAFDYLWYNKECV